MAKAATKAAPEDKKPPAHKMSLGALECATWANETVDSQTGKVRIWYTVDLERNYLDRDEVWRKSSQLRESDVSNAITLLQDAQAFILAAKK